MINMNDIEYVYYSPELDEIKIDSDTGPDLIPLYNRHYLLPPYFTRYDYLYYYTGVL